MNTMPTEIYICGQRHTISVDAERVSFAWGHLDREAHIAINAGLVIGLQRETLLHEVVHGVDVLTCDRRLTVDLKERDEHAWATQFRLTEPTTVAFSRGLWMTLTDPRNADAVAWIFDR